MSVEHGLNRELCILTAARDESGRKDKHNLAFTIYHFPFFLLFMSFFSSISFFYQLFGLSLHQNLSYNTMKRFTFPLFLILFTLAGCRSHYALQSVEPHRIEVTRALDARPVASAVDFVAPYRVGVDSLRAPRVGESAMYMSAHRPESLLSNWVADALVSAARRQGFVPDFGLCNIGGLRAAMPEGVVRRGDIINISPFQNYLTVLTLRGRDVQQLMCDIAAVNGEGLSSAVRLLITRSGELRSASIGGEPIDTTRNYIIATLDYLAEGNDKIFSLKRHIGRENTTIAVSDVLMQELEALDAEGKKATAAIEGRVSMNDEGTLYTSLERSKEVGGKETAIEVMASSGTKYRELLVVHTNDTHSCIDPLSPYLADTANADKGGYLRRAALLRDLRQKEPALLLFDSGDFSQGSPFYNLYRGGVEVGLMNLMGYDAATIGNHEFDFGLENMARIFRMAKFPILCCNYDFRGTPVEGTVKPYTVIKRGGLRIGVTGVSPQLESLVASHVCEGVNYIDPREALPPVVETLRKKEKCDLVICLSHLGWMASGTSDEELIPATEGIDLVLGGHSHTYFASPQILKAADGREVPVNQMGKNARYVGTLRLRLQKK